MNKKVTMQDIADYLNISKNSVSQALSGKPGVSDETRKQVQETANKLGYNYTPRQSNTISKMENIALIASDFALSQTSFFGKIYLSVQKEVKKKGMNLLIESISPKDAKELVLPYFIKSKSVQGIIILSHITTDYINEVISTGIPTILIDHHHPHIEADSILTNNRFGAYLAVEYMIKRNHKNIAFVGNAPFSPSYYERLQGYIMAHEDYHLPVKNKFILKDSPDQEDIVKQFIDNLEEMPTAWFCINDRLGYIVNNLLKERGYQVPEEVSVFSFDNGQLCQLSTPRISSVDIDLQQYGIKGVELLLWRMEHPNDPHQEIVISPRIVEGQSIGWNKSDVVALG
ncbi:LacI family DNA-binding transcriptional regulator [Bacillus timonensis]|uniref:LacI family DNA-binding transcriptional regulator n=1 Tax=Bacillus timonensis TaxID=1033734 RepID=A0A4S3PWV8_9BACI|nr:LacI family DNA-binding transcriptional regulator [Bacillus timonensis]THE13946.1 LacI family DNA-binding transcriptional regulator [Bacillus timonensis]